MRETLPWFVRIISLVRKIFPVWQNVTGVHRVMTSTSYNTFGVNWNAKFVLLDLMYILLTEIDKIPAGSTIW